PVLDRNGLVIMMLVGQPRPGEGWGENLLRAQRRIEITAPEMGFTAEETNHRRGNFPAVAVGLSLGTGRTAPGHFVHSQKRARTLEALTSDPAIVRLAGFASTAFALYAPRLFGFYRQQMDRLFEWSPSLAKAGRNSLFPNSVFAATTINFGPNTVTDPHRDMGNLAWGWCAVTAMGQFDPRRGGHIVLWDLGLVIEFPPGSTILIPSAVVTHSNTPIQPGEKCFSFTQYTAAGLFRWVYNGFMSDGRATTDGAGHSTLTAAQAAQRSADTQRRWRDGLAMFSTLDELVGPA
ncbi:hypothetical protein PLICRDRAFT_119504, partial [Plicaturopsis crispa FD-325 SS-3]